MGNAESGGGGGGNGGGFSVASDRDGFTIAADRDGFTISGGPAGTTASFDGAGAPRVGTNVSSYDTVKHMTADAARTREGPTNKSLQGVHSAYQEYSQHGTMGISTHDGSKFYGTTVRDPPSISSISIATGGSASDYFRDNNR